MKLLMHMCCSNCSIYPLQSLLLDGIDVRGFWFNPNIHPYTEYASRLESLMTLGRLWNLDIAYEDDYALDAFLSSVAGKGVGRCPVCYELRLDRAAREAKRMNLDGFTTSLLVSPYQKFDMIQTIGREAGKRHGIPFHATDFRTGWKTTQRLSRELGLYRQRYCGCIYSERDRFVRSKNT